MKKTLSLLAAVVVLAVLLVGGRSWMASVAGDEPPVGLSPREEESPSEARAPLGLREVAGHAAGAAEVEEDRGPPPPSPSFIMRGVMGRVVDSERQVVAGAAVSCSLVCGTERSHVGWTKSGHDGRYSLDADLQRQVAERIERRSAYLEALKDGVSWGGSRRFSRQNRRDVQELLENLDDPLFLEVTASARKHDRAVRRLLLGKNPPEVVRVDLMLETEFVFGGQVLGNEGSGGRAGSGAGVALLDRDWKVTGTTRTNERGAFEFRTPDPGLFLVHARQEGAGAGVTGGFHLTPQLGSPKLKVPLDGEGTLRGQVLLSDGTPVIGVEVTGIQDGLLAIEPDRPEHPEPSALAQAEASGGLAFSHAVTDEEGRFWMEAMQEGRYALRFEGLPERYQPEGPFPTGVENDLVYTARVLEVIVLGPDFLLPRSRVHCALVVPPGSPVRRAVRSPRKRQAMFPVEAGTTWRIWCELHGERSDEELVTIRETALVTEIDLELPELEELLGEEEHPFALEPPAPPEPGSLVVELVDEKGEPQPTRITLWRVDGSDQTCIHDSLPRAPRQPLTGLRAGVYRVQARATGESGATLLPVEEETLRIEAGREERVVLQGERGGRLELDLTLPAKGSDRLVQARLVPPDGGGAIALAFVPQANPGARPSPTAYPGTKVTCDPPVPAGRYELQLISFAFELSTQPVDIRVGEATSATVEFVPRGE